MMLEQRVGLCDTIKTAKSLGIKRADGGPLQEFETFTLGINEMDPVTVANAYAAIGARGKYCAPMAITQITDRDGKATDVQAQVPQALDPEVADAAADVLSGVFTKGTMRGVGGIGRDAAGKTGTTDDYAAAWFAGFTPDLAGAVSIGDPRGSQKHKLNGVTIGGRYYGAVFGATHPGPDLEGHDAGGAEGRPGRRRSRRSTRPGSAAAVRAARPRSRGVTTARNAMACRTWGTTTSASRIRPAASRSEQHPRSSRPGIIPLLGANYA